MSEPRGSPNVNTADLKPIQQNLIPTIKGNLQNVAKELNLNYCKLICSYSQNSDVC